MRGRAVVASVAALLILDAPMRAQNAPALPDILKMAGDYLVQYSQKLGAVAADEEYVQYDTSSGQMTVPKRVESEFVLLGGGNGTFAGFRDVVAIDKAPVHPADGRLLALFKAPSTSTLSAAQQMTDDAVRYYIGGNLHALDQPTVALVFLQSENQSRSSFKLEGLKNQTATVRFTEQSTPHLIPSTVSAGAIGRFVIDTASGAIRQTELGISSRSVNLRSTVKYVEDKTTGLWLPSEMYQQISVSGGGAAAAHIAGVAGAAAAHADLLIHLRRQP